MITTYLHYTMKLRSPAIVTTMSGDPNSAATQMFIPGSSIRGAVAAYLLAKGEDNHSDVFQKLVLSGDVRYFHAYPQIAKERSMPTPLSWKSSKDSPENVHDLIHFSGHINKDDDQDDENQPWPKDALKSVSGPFCLPMTTGGKRTTITPEMGARIHQQRDRVKGRSWKEGEDRSHGAIFAYEYLEAEQVFCGVIQVLPSATPHLAQIKQFLSRQIFVGRSRRAGYGGEAQLCETKSAKQEYEQVGNVICKDIQKGENFCVVLTSAYIGRHPITGQMDPSALECEISKVFHHKVSVEQKRWSFETLGGFNRKWRLEIPQVSAVRAGSVVVLKAIDLIPYATLQQIECDGIGERRVDGLGRLVFLEYTKIPKEFEIESENSSTKAPTLLQPSLQENTQLEFLETRLILSAAKAELDRVANLDIVSKVNTKSIPTNSLLSRLRSTLRGVVDEGTAKVALRNLALWCDGSDNPLALKRAAREKLENCQITNKHLREWIYDTASKCTNNAEPSGWKALLEASKNPSSLTGLAAKNYLSAQSNAQAILEKHGAMLCSYLIDAVLVAMIRKNRGNKS